ncbi:MAG: pyridoxamine 5'-phosphate oxidase family protein [Gammaproteobacteria bacterium]|nr:pyridoxamine 5'-phosphate oxidase family protein [Gammaproteobacteria bacterium]MBI5615304.1 pyridoxamine 5'-phosphate oxidase family protein [Gammaproteobacteria bacterium]
MTTVLEASGSALAYLAAHNVATLATCGPAGPWAAAVFYVNEDFTLYFLSAPTTRHSADIAHDARVAATIQEDYARWQDIKGIQLEGRAVRLAGAAAAEAYAHYAAKFPFTMAGTAAEVLARALAKVAWYRLDPVHLYFIDNAQGFGHREEIPLAR